MDKPDPKRASLVVAPAEAKVIKAFGSELHFLLTGDQTENRQLLATLWAHPGGGPPPHYHTCEDESFFVMEGEISVLSAGEWKKVSAGSVCYTPKNTIHTFRNDTDTPAKLILLSQPSGFDVFFEECSVEFAKPGGPDMQRLVEIAANHGIYFV